MTQSVLARRVGRSQSAIANKLRLLSLPEPVQKRVSQIGIGERHARALLQLSDEKEQMDVLSVIEEGELTVRETERLIQRRVSGSDTGDEAQKKVIRIFKDLRLFRNSLKTLVDGIRDTGLDVNWEEEQDQKKVVWTVTVEHAERNQKSPD